MIYEVDTGEPIADLVARVTAEKRLSADRAWLMLNMVTSIDGATVVDGGSTSLSDQDDRLLFHALRAVADRVLVGAGTVRAENYRPVEGLVIVSGSLDLDPETRVFSDPTARPTLLTDENADPGRVKRLGEVADVVALPSLDGLSLAAQLSDSGVVLCEGGPTLNGHLLSAGVVDEVNWTVSPLVVSGNANRMVTGPSLATFSEFQLSRMWRGDRSLFLRYVKHR